jgi:hypothetical protein
MRVPPLLDGYASRFFGGFQRMVWKPQASTQSKLPDHWRDTTCSNSNFANVVKLLDWQIEWLASFMVDVDTMIAQTNGCAFGSTPKSADFYKMNTGPDRVGVLRWTHTIHGQARSPFEAQLMAAGGLRAMQATLHPKSSALL